MTSRRMLRVEAPHFTAGAVWVKKGDRWQCERAAPIIAWMMGKSIDEVLLYLQRKGWQWQAGKITSPAPSSSPNSD